VIDGRGVTARDGLAHHRHHAPLEVAVVVGVLDEDPGGLRAVLADETVARPAEQSDDGLQPSGVLAIDHLPATHRHRVDALRVAHDTDRGVHLAAHLLVHAHALEELGAERRIQDRRRRHGRHR
jgi:hypothetical protein